MWTVLVQPSEARTFNIKTLFINFEDQLYCYSYSSTVHSLIFDTIWVTSTDVEAGMPWAWRAYPCNARRLFFYVPTILLAYDWSKITVKVSTNHMKSIQLLLIIQVYRNYCDYSTNINNYMHNLHIYNSSAIRLPTSPSLLCITKTLL